MSHCSLISSGCSGLSPSRPSSARWKRSSPGSLQALFGQMTHTSTDYSPLTLKQELITTTSTTKQRTSVCVHVPVDDSTRTNDWGHSTWADQHNLQGSTAGVGDGHGDSHMFQRLQTRLAQISSWDWGRHGGKLEKNKKSLRKIIQCLHF